MVMDYSTRSKRNTTKRDIVGLHNSIMQTIDSEELHTLSAKDMAERLRRTYNVNGTRFNVTADYLEGILTTYNSSTISNMPEKRRIEMEEHIRDRCERRKAESPKLNLGEIISKMSQTLRMQDEEGIYSATTDLIESVLLTNPKLREEHVADQIGMIYQYEAVVNPSKGHFVREATLRLGEKYGADYIAQKSKEYWNAHQKPSLFKRILKRLKAA